MQLVAGQGEQEAKHQGQVTPKAISRAANKCRDRANTVDVSNNYFGSEFAIIAVNNSMLLPLDGLTRVCSGDW